MVTIQLRRIINAYLGRSTKPVLNRILRLSNFRLQNSSNFNAAIQIFLWLHEPNYPIFYSYVKFRLLVAQLIFVLERDDLYLQGFLPPTSDNKPEVFRHGTIYHRRHYMKRKFLDWLKLKICGSDLHKFFLSEKPLSCEQWKPFPSNNRWEHKMSWSLTYCPAKIRTKVWYASFSLWLLILRSYQIASQTSSFSTIVILSESKTYRPMRKNSKSQNSVTPHCKCINVYRFWLQEKFFFGTSFNSLTVWIVAKF